MRSTPPRTAALWVVALAATTSGCLQQIAVRGLSSALAGAGDVYASDDDPELVREAMPFGLKSMEALIVEAPEDDQLLLATCRGFTQYAYAFVETDALLEKWDDWKKSEATLDRARRLYLRARDYGLRGLEVLYPGIGASLPSSPEESAARVGKEGLPLLYWTGVAWGAAISDGMDHPELLADVDVVRACLRRVLAVDPDFGGGAIHQAMLSIECLPEAMGGSRERAKQQFDEAVKATDGKSAGPYVTLATGSSVARQDRAEFVELLDEALAIDPDERPGTRLSNLIAQKRARFLLDNADELFVQP